MAILTKEAEARIVRLLVAEGLADGKLVSEIQNKIDPSKQRVIDELIKNKIVTNDMVSHATAIIIGVPYVELKNITIDQDILINDISELVKDINDKCSIIHKTLVCPKCGSHYRSRDLNYLVCNCGFICDLSENKLKFYHSQKDSSYSKITSKGWGMDIIE